MNYGEKISRLRKSKGMTQEELGKVLNVTYQAVSKWERDESLPDFATMSQIAKFFQVPLSYFEDGEAASEIAPAEATASAASAGGLNNVLGICSVCGRMIKEDEAFEVSPKIICKDCHERAVKEEQKAAAERARAEKYRKERELQEQLGSGFDAKLIVSIVLAVVAYVVFTIFCFSKKDFGDRSLMAVITFIAPLAVFAITHAFGDLINDIRNRDDGPDGYKLSVSLIVAGIFAVVNFVLFLVIYLNSDVKAFYLPLIFISVICSFTFVSQYLWGGAVQDIFTCGGFTFKIPLVIFHLNPESILMMIITKIILGLLAVLIFIVTTIFFALIAIFGSVITFIPGISIKAAKDKRAKNSV